MIDTISILAWSCFPDGTTEFLNQRWLDYTGLSHERALGWGWKSAIHPEDLDKLISTWLRLLASGEPGQEEARLRRFDGEYRCFLSALCPCTTITERLCVGTARTPTSRSSSAQNRNCAGARPIWPKHRDSVLRAVSAGVSDGRADLVQRDVLY